MVYELDLNKAINMASVFNSNGNGDIKQIKSVPERQILHVSLICSSWILYSYKQTMCAQMTSKWKQNDLRD